MQQQNLILVYIVILALLACSSSYSSNSNSNHPNVVSAAPSLLSFLRSSKYPPPTTQPSSQQQQQQQKPLDSSPPLSGQEQIVFDNPPQLSFPSHQKPSPPSKPQQQQQQQQHHHEDSSSEFNLAGQDRPDQTLVLRHLLHHGGNRYPNLYRRMDLGLEDVLLSELLTGQSLIHTVKVKTTTTLKPKINSYRNQGFRSYNLRGDRSIGPESWIKKIIEGPNIDDKETMIQFAKMNYNSYTEVASPGWYDLEGNWGVNSTFGWEEDGVRGHVFASRDNKTLIIAIKGTSASLLGGGGSTSTRDKINDNLLFSCCCAKVDRTWRGVCDCNTGGYQCDQTCIENSLSTDEVYYGIAMQILWTVQDMYPGANVWLTGHSLGGGISSLLGLTFGVPTVTFEAPGDRLAAMRLHLPMPPAINWYDLPLFHVGHTADPIFQGVCNGPRSACYYSGFALESKCHTGRTCVYDPVAEDNWRVDVRTHRLFDTIEGVLKPKEVPVCKPEVGCVDCGMWEYL